MLQLKTFTANLKLHLVNNAKQIVLGMHNHHDTFLQFPARARAAPKKNRCSAGACKFCRLWKPGRFMISSSMTNRGTARTTALIAKMPRVFASPLAPPETRRRGKNHLCRAGCTQVDLCR